jgi:hypothetical protein
MSQTKIAVVVGSLRRDSFNRKLAAALTKLAPADVAFSTIEIGDLPLYNEDDDANQAPSVQRLKAEVAADSASSVDPCASKAVSHSSRTLDMPAVTLARTRSSIASKAPGATQ